MIDKKGVVIYVVNINLKLKQNFVLTTIIKQEKFGVYFVSVVISPLVIMKIIKIRLKNI